MIDGYAIRRWVDDFKYKLGAAPKRLLILVGVAAVLAPVVVVVLWSTLKSGGGRSPAEDVAFRAVAKEALASDEGKADIARLAAMSDAELGKELKARHDAMDTLAKAGQKDSEAGTRAWAAQLRVVQVHTDRLRRAGKREDR